MPGWTAPITERWSVGDDLTWCQLCLHDEASLFPRDELLRWYLDAYRQLLARAQSTRQFRILDVPPRYTLTYTYDWEQYFALNGSSRQLGYRGPSGSVYAYAWELEHAEGIAVTDGAAVLCTQLWEYAYTLDASTDQTYTFAVPRQHERIARVYWDNKALESRAVKELDQSESVWWRGAGDPWVWTRGTQGVRHFDLYQLQAGYQQGYELQSDPEPPTLSALYPFELGLSLFDNGRTRQIGYQGTLGRVYTYEWERVLIEGTTAVDTAGVLNTQLWEYAYTNPNPTDQAFPGGDPGALYGVARELHGDRTYGYSTDDAGGVPYGLVRSVESPDRQYLAQPTWDAPLGTIREWRTSALAVLLWEIVIEDHPLLAEEDIPSEIPAQLQKYLRCYVLWRCFARQGEGQRLDLAAWFQQRWLRGVALMTRLGVVTRRDRGFQRQGGSGRRAVSRPRLPSDFPRYVSA